ncbi:MAG: nuclease-related domain-containing protein [Pseudomonadota bacterium]
MAQMHPDDIEDYEDATEGEKKAFRFIREAARPHKDFVCWYEPPIGSSGNEPDFILFSKKLGLLVIEVKDWNSQQIIAYNPHQFSIIVSGKTEQKTNPDKQAKGYVNTLKEAVNRGLPLTLDIFRSCEPRASKPIAVPRRPCRSP